MNTTSNTNNTAVSSGNSKLPEGLKKRLLFSNSNYNVPLTNKTNTSDTYAAAFIGYLNLGPIEAVENDPSSQIFVNNKTVMIKLYEIGDFISDCLKAYKMFLSQEYQSFSNIISSSSTQRLVSSFDVYKTGYFYQIRVQFKKKVDYETAHENNFFIDEEEDEKDTNWLYTQKGIIFSQEKLKVLLSHLDYLLLSTVPLNDSGQRYLSEIYEACQETQNTIIADEFFKNIDLRDINSMTYMARRKKIKELLTNYGKYYLNPKKKPLQDFQRSKIVHNLMHKFNLVCAVLAILKYFFFKYVVENANSMPSMIGQQTSPLNPDTLR